MKSQRRKSQEVSEKISSKVSMVNNDLFSKTNNFLKEKKAWAFAIIMIIEIVISYLLFDLKMTPGGDDSAYILNAFDFIHSFKYPGQFEGALYPFFISVFIKYWGVNIVLLKCVSFLCMIVFFAVFYLSFKNKIPELVLFSAMLLMSVNAHLLYFATHTYTEAFFLIIQGVLFLVMNKFFLEQEYDKQINWKTYLLLGAVLFLLTLAKNVGLACFIATLIFLVLIKKWKDATFVTLSFSGFYILFEVIKRTVWPETNFQIKSHGSSLLYKDFYNPSKGYEDFNGVVNRIVGNSNQYLSRDLFNIIGLRDSVSVMPILTILVYIFFFVLVYFLFRKNKLLLFAGIYAGVMSFLTFVLIQTSWGQERLIVIFVPYFLLFFLGGIYFFIKKFSVSTTQIIFFLVVGILFLASVGATSKTVKVKRNEFVQNIKKDPYKGFNEGVENFIRMSRWAADSMPQNDVIACRKPEISFAYTGRKFLGIYSVPNITFDSLYSIINRDTAHVYAIVKYQDFFIENGTKMYNVFNEYKKYFSLCVAVSGLIKAKPDERVEFLYLALPKNRRAEFQKAMDAHKILVMDDVHSLQQLYANNSFKIYEPEALLDWLKESKVKYVIMSNFALTDRLKPSKSEYVTTVQQFIRPIDIKYGAFKLLHTIGKEDVSSVLLEVDYDKIAKEKM